MSEDEPPSEKHPVIHNFIETSINNILSNTTAWPENLFKLKLESAGIYQDFSGPSIAELDELDEITRFRSGNHRYFAKTNGEPNRPAKDIKNATEIIYGTLNDQHRAYFAECVSYIALTKIYDELRDHIAIDVLPKGNYPRKLRGFNNELDGFVELRNELFPVEVYNGQRFVTDTDKKMDEGRKLSSDEEPVSNPLLITRISSKDARDIIFKMNGLIIDTGKIFICGDNQPEIQQALRTLHISDHYEFFPKFQTTEGIELDGKSYHDFAKKHSTYPNIMPLKTAPASAELSKAVMRRFRGGIHLLYVNTFYRNASGRINKESCLVLQEIYNRLLRLSKGAEYDEILEQGWEDFTNRYRRLKNPKSRKDAILERTQDHIRQLKDEKIVTRRGETIYARLSDHPHISLNFSNPNVKEEKI